MYIYLYFIYAHISSITNKKNCIHSKYYNIFESDYSNLNIILFVCFFFSLQTDKTIAINNIYVLHRPIVVERGKVNCRHTHRAHMQITGRTIYV